MIQNSNNALVPMVAALKMNGRFLPVKIAAVTLLILFIHLIGFSQTVRYTVKGSVTDTNGKSISGAVVSFLKIPSGELLKQDISDESGNFGFNHVENGCYLVSGSALGFIQSVSDTLVLHANSAQDVHINIRLMQNQLNLKEVVVKNENQSIEINNNKVILNVNDNALSAGASGLELLRKLPGVTIGQDDNLMLNGTNTPNVMIDGKMTYLGGKQLSEMLKTFNSSNIIKIELLTSPSAEFDAAGNGGIINIITKKRIGKGYAIDLKSGISKGKYVMLAEGVSASLRTEKFNVNGAFDYTTPHRYIKSSSGNTINESGENKIIKRDNDASFRVKYYSYQLGLEWKISPRHHLNVSYNGYLDDFSAKKNSTVTKYTDNAVPYALIKSTNSIVEPYYYDAGNINYKFNIDTLGKNVTADVHYISYRNYSDGLMSTSNHDIQGNQIGIDGILRSKQPGFISILSLKTDAELSFKFVSIKTGLKYAHVSNDNKFSFDSLINNEYREVFSMSNHFSYEEGIAAGYLSASKKIHKTNVNAGLRVEYTQAKGYTDRQAINNQWMYTRFFPSFSVDHEFNETNKASISASRRIDRPAYTDLNPVRWYNDQYFFYSGNPYLKPEMAWLLSLAYSFKHKYVVTASYSRHTDYLSRWVVTEPGTNALISQSANFGKMHRLDVTCSTPIHIFEWWKLQITSGINYTTYPINQLNGIKQLSKLAGNILADQSIKLPHNISVEIGSYWYSSELWGIYEKKGIFFIDSGIKKTFLNNKLDVRVALSDILNTYVMVGKSQSDDTNYYFRDKRDTRRINVVLLYHIGGKLQKTELREIEEQNRL